MGNFKIRGVIAVFLVIVPHFIGISPILTTAEICG